MMMVRNSLTKSKTDRFFAGIWGKLDGMNIIGSLALYFAPIELQKPKATKPLSLN